ncbi:PLP-dependent aminotransferase family protein [Oxalobacteraceae bacterium CAVE-383]|nr:PLP-dependent aminotransferase family protein [Oxalobacteraceae bacterium CAVE-383]
MQTQTPASSLLDAPLPRPGQAAQPLYRRLADHYLTVIQAGTLAPGDRMPSVRHLMRQHEVSLSTALQAWRHLEQGGWLEARDRSGYFVRQPKRTAIGPATEPAILTAQVPAQYLGMHQRLSEIISQGRQQPIRIDLSSCNCASEQYAVNALKNGTIRTLRQNPSVLTSVLPYNGHPAFRTAVARRALRTGIQITPDQVVVTQGCIEAINLALRAVAQPGDIIAVESPTFYGVLHALESLGMRALEIPTSPATGISIDALELALRTYDNVKAVLVVPNLQNPLGCTMPEANKASLVALCERHAVALIEDDTYTELSDSSVPLTALKARDRTGNVIYCASLNKVLAAGMRLGWLTGGKWQARVEMLKYSQTRANEVLSQIVAADFMMEGGYDRHLRRMRDYLRGQREKMAEAVASYFPAGTRLTIPKGGIVLWVELPGPASSQAIFEAALKQGIRIAPGVMFTNSDRFDHFLRLSCGQQYTEEVDRAVRFLGDTARRLLQV